MATRLPVRLKDFYIYAFLLLIVIIYFLSGCVNQSPKQDEPKQEIKLNFTPAWGKDKPHWTLAALHSVEFESMAELYPRDISEFCPKYIDLDAEGRRWFWVGLISIMTKYESGFNLNFTYQEPKPPLGPGTLSVGLLQLSKEDGKHYLVCRGTTDELLKTYDFNLKCGINILSTLVRSNNYISKYDGKKWLGGPRYWSVLRPLKKGKPRKSYVAIKEFTRKFAKCGG